MSTYSQEYEKRKREEDLLSGLTDLGSEIFNSKMSMNQSSLDLSNRPSYSSSNSSLRGSKMFGKNSASALKAGKGALKSGGGNIGNVGVALKMFDLAGKTLDITTGALNLNTEQVNQSSADRAGFGGANKLTGLINKIPGAQFMTAFGASDIPQFTESAYWNSVGSGFSATRADSNAAKDIGGTRMLFGADKAKTFVNKVNAQNAAITRIGMASELARANDVGQLYQQQNFNKYQGYTPALLLSRNGGTIPELEESRKMLYKKTAGTTISKYQLGGKIIDPSKNIIPDGALHKNLNHLSDTNEELIDQITRKGVPVVSEDAEGNITQHAEVEVGEIIFTLENSQKLEEYWKQYKETEDDNIAIECGKFVTHEILRNTVDKAGIKKQVE